MVPWGGCRPRYLVLTLDAAAGNKLDEFRKSYRPPFRLPILITFSVVLFLLFRRKRAVAVTQPLLFQFVGLWNQQHQSPAVRGPTAVGNSVCFAPFLRQLQLNVSDAEGKMGMQLGFIIRSGRNLSADETDGGVDAMRRRQGVRSSRA